MAATKEVVGVDEGSVYTGPNPDGEYKGPVDGEDRAGVYGTTGEVTDDGILLTAPNVKPVVRAKAGKASKGAAPVVFTNTRFPEQKISITQDRDGATHRTGKRVEFHSGKLMTTDPAVVEQIEALNRAYIYREPDNFTEVDPESKAFFRHDATGFRTLVKEAYEDWVNNSEWSAVPR